jgi:dienelactone hydrolase
MGFPPDIPSDPAPPPGPPPDAGAGPAFFAEQDSLRRAMPMQRLLSGGMRYADAVALHAAADARIGWSVCAEWLGNRNLRVAGVAPSERSARQWYRYASACFRVAQAAIATDTPKKKTLFSSMIESFGAACAHDSPPGEKHEIGWRSGKLCGWLLRPPQIENPPVIILIGGFDGWREEYHSCAVELVDRGIAAFLLDGPGQGESRLFHGLYLDNGFSAAFAEAATYLRTQCNVGSRIGIWGNSLGGFLAARTVIDYPDLFDALCVNGGTIRPLELPERFPRFFEKVEAMVGTTDRNHVLEVMGELEILPGKDSLACPLLQLHSVPDQVFLLQNARIIHDRIATGSKELMIWEDGDHCMYNHFEEKNIAASEWFDHVLTPERST